MEKAGFKLSIKSMDDGGSGTFTGLASTYGNTDLTGDIVVPGAFTRTITEQKGTFPLLWQHHSDSPIGSAQVTDTPAGLEVAGELVLESEKAREAYALMKKKIIKGLSIGYDSVKSYAKDGARYLQEIRLWEISLVTFPANPEAQVVAVKSAEEILIGERIARCEEVLDEARQRLARIG